MRSVLEVMQFEIRFQLRSPFFIGALLMFALIHFLSITGSVIHIDISNQVAINSAYAILQIELAMFIAGLLPVIAFVTTAITRDFEYSTASLVFVTPVSRRDFVLGRFLGAFALALLISLAGLLAAMLGTFMPWLDPARIAPFSIVPWAYVFLVVLLPNTLVLSAIFFSVAALTRSVALTWAAAIAFFVAEVLLNLVVKLGGASWTALADPSSRLSVAVETRYWTIAELNAKLPFGFLAQNRVLWLTLAIVVLLLAMFRFRLDLAEKPASRFWRRLQITKAPVTPQPVIQAITPEPSFSRRDSFAQFISQLKMDLSWVFKSPLTYIILALEIANLFAEFQGNVSRVGFTTPLYPLTSQMLPILRFGMLTQILLVGLWYSGELIHRERASGIGEIIYAAPFPDWLMIAAKTSALCIVVNAMMLVAVITLIALQASTGYAHFEVSLYLQSAFIYNGLYYCLLWVLAVVVQAISPNKWLGMLIMLGLYAGLMSLGSMGFDHVLYGFSIPDAVYSDMNGFGHFTKPVFSLIAYWGAFCVLLFVAALLLYPRGNYSNLRERLIDARTRIGAGVIFTASCAAVAFVTIGGWIFYNTNILNVYLTPNERMRQRVDYERNYARYEDAPTPSYESIEMAVDIFPEERRLESRGSAILGNHKKEPISEFVVSVKPMIRVNQIAIEKATLAQSDKTQGFYLFRLNEPLAPGARVKMTWSATRTNQGFVAADPDNEIVANGTFVGTLGVMPVPGYDSERRIIDNSERHKYGLEPAPRTAALGDTARLYKIAFGVDSRTAFEIILSTSADQLAVAPGILQKEWLEGGRRYFHYKAEEPILPNLSFCSARYQVARDRWNDVALEVYYDPKHPFNIAAMMDTAKRALEYFSTEFAPYQYSYLRIVEFPRYRSVAKFMPGIVPYSEAIGFVTDLRQLENADYGVMHELAHMWWGDRIVGAQMQGREMLTENMAEYSTQMLFRERYPRAYIDRLTQLRLDSYLDGRSSEKEAEQPLVYADHRSHKGPLAMYALQDIIGKEKVHAGLRNFLREYSFRTSPCPTSKDLVNALRATAGSEYQQLITDLFERIVLYDLQVDAASAREIDGGYEVTIEVTARQFAADGRGKETEEPLEMWFDVAVFAEKGKPLDGALPMYISKHLLHSGKQILTIRSPHLPGSVSLDPFHKMIERNSEDNRRTVELLTASRS
jgi:ABC-2 type transport system permease protein